MIKDMVISTFLAVLYIISVASLTVATVNVVNIYVDLYTFGIFPSILFGLFYAFVSYDVYYKPILDTI